MVLRLEGLAVFVALHAAHLLAMGVALMGFGMLALWRDGGGLPMNAFPPPRLVTGSIYALVPHPIYVGFVAVVA